MTTSFKRDSFLTRQALAKDEEGRAAKRWRESLSGAEYERDAIAAAEREAAERSAIRLLRMAQLTAQMRDYVRVIPAGQKSPCA